MEAVGEMPDGSEFYVLTQDESDGFRRIKTVVLVVTQFSGGAEDLAGDGDCFAHMRPCRIRYFADIGEKMDRVVNWIRGA